MVVVVLYVFHLKAIIIIIMIIIIIIIIIMSLFNEDNIFSKHTYLTYGPLKSKTDIRTTQRTIFYFFGNLKAEQV